MNFYEELIRIAELLEDESDRAILYSAAMQFAPGPEPTMQKTEKVGNLISHWWYYGS